MIKEFKEFVIALISKNFELNVAKLTIKQSLLIKDFIETVFETFTADTSSKYPTISLLTSENDLIELIQRDCTLLACLLYRIERQLFLGEEDVQLLALLSNFMRTSTGIELYYSTQIGKGLNIQHGTGIVVGPRYKIGENFLIHQGVTLGQRKGAGDVIIVGNNVAIFAGAKVLGNLTIGNNVKIAANAVLLTDAIENSTYAGVPAFKIN